jgi:hypothetical protein
LPTRRPIRICSLHTGKLNRGFVDIAEQALKNISKPVAGPRRDALKARSPAPWAIGGVARLARERAEAETRGDR